MSQNRTDNSLVDAQIKKNVIVAVVVGCVGVGQK
jgi:hypothetical protein